MLTAILDKIRPQVQAQITEQNSLYFFHKKSYNVSVPFEKEPDMRNFEYYHGTSQKFWCITQTHQIPGGLASEYVVRVKYGRIGRQGQTHLKVFPNMFEAQVYYEQKIKEKVSKGYVEKIKVAKPEAAIIKPTFENFGIVAPPETCEHANLSRKGNSWKCCLCGHTVEFVQPGKQFLTSEPASVGVVEEKVKRFINLNWKDEE